MTTRPSLAIEWDPEAYTRFALRAQLPSLWLLGKWLVARCAAGGVPLRPRDRILDAAAGPALLSRLLAAASGLAVDAIPQNAAFGRLAARPLLPSMPGSVTLRAAPVGTYRLVTAYGLLHEQEDPAAFVDRLAALVEPGGMLVLVDTAADARAAVERALAASALSAAERALVGGTFASSFERRDAERLAARLPGGATVEAVDPGEELLLDAELTRPSELDAEIELSILEPTLFALAWRSPPPPTPRTETP